MIGKEHKGALLTINDRATGLLVMGKVDTKESIAIETKTIELLQDWKPLWDTYVQVFSCFIDLIILVFLLIFFVEL